MFNQIYEDEKYFFILIKNENLNEIQKKLEDNTLQIWEYKDNDNENSSVLHISIFLDLTEITFLLLNYIKKNISPDLFTSFINQKNNKGVIALHYASLKGNIKIIKLLIENNANINEVTNTKLNIIHFAAQGNQPNSIVFFHENYPELNLDSKEEEGKTPFHFACFYKNEEVVLYLINFGININEQDNSGFTPLHIAIINKNIRIIKRLLQNGALLNIKDKKERTPYQFALFKKYSDIAVILKNSEKNTLCTCTEPIKKINRSNFNIYLLLFFQFCSCFILFCCIFPFCFIIDNSIFQRVLYLVYLGSFILFLGIYVFLIFSNPGILENKNKKFNEILDSGENLLNYCCVCKIKFKRNSKHCVICNKCCEGFDHHCSWVNNCIGRKNYALFYIFLYISFFQLISILIICFESVNLNLDKTPKDYRDCNLFDKKLSFDILFSIPKCTILFTNTLVKNIFEILLIISNLIFLIPILLLIILHTRKICLLLPKKYNDENNKKDEINGSLLSESLLSDDID